MHARRARDLIEGRRPRLERPEARLALDIPLTVARLRQLACREGGSANHLLDMLCDRLLVPQAVLDGCHTPMRERGRCRFDRRLGVHRLRRDDSELAGRKLGRIRGRCQPPQRLTRTAEAKPIAVDRIDVLPEEVVGPDLDVLELSEVRGEERADRAAADHAHPHEYDASLAATSRYRAVCRGAATPRRSASRTSAPLISSTSVGR